MKQVMTRQELLDRLESHPHMELFEVTDAYAVVYDQRLATDFTVYFAESFTLQQLKQRIHVCPGLPAELTFDLDAMAQYLWQVMDHNAFLTLNGLWFVGNDADYRSVAEFHNYDEAILLPEYDAKGCMWFARQVCIVDVGRIARRGRVLSHIRRDILVTALHELRHLMLETNPVLSVEAYPVELGSEFLVERYAQEICEDSAIARIFKA